MKKVFFAFILTLIYTNGYNQAPGKFTCQAIVRDAQNELLAYRNVGIEITITAGSETGHVVFKETHEAVTNSHGMINLEIGAGTIVTGILSAIKWNMGPFYIRTAVDPTGGDDYTLVTSAEFYAVPYALYSDFAEKVRDPLIETQALSDILAKGDSAGNSIKGLLDPTEDGDLITLQYLLNLVALVYDTLTWIPVNDIEGNSYSCILVGNKVWMSENLRTGTLNDGTVIPLITSEAEWTALNTPGYCWYNNSLPNSYPAKEYGALYNWYTVNTENLCPSGWRVPDNSDWDELIEFFGGSLSAGAVLKENGTKHWLIPNITRGLMSSFKALPGGYRTDDFYGQGSYGKFWSSNETSVSASNTLSLDSPSENAEMIPATKKTGLSIRCVKDVHIMHP